MNLQDKKLHLPCFLLDHLKNQHKKTPGYRGLFFKNQNHRTCKDLILLATHLAAALLCTFHFLFCSTLALACCPYLAVPKPVTEIYFKLRHLSPAPEAALYTGKIGFTTPPHGLENIACHQFYIAFVFKYGLLQSKINKAHRSRPYHSLPY